MAINDLVTRIQSDAAAEAAALLDGAKAEADAAIGRAKAAAAAERAALLEAAERSAAEEAATLLANARLAARDELLAHKRMRAERVLERAWQAVESLPDAEYLESIASAVAAASRGGETLQVAEPDAERLAGLGSRLEQLGVRVRLSEDFAPLARGVLLAGDRVRVEISPTAMVADRRDELLLVASRSLFSGRG
ncbi:MAG: hypothetical protein ACYCXZ_04220 [Coriobacteriia bacterium]